MSASPEEARAERFKQCGTGCNLFAKLLAWSLLEDGHLLAMNGEDRPQVLCRGVKKRAYVHVFIHQNGPVPKGKQVNHTCDLSRCWEPEHLYAGTQADGMEDRAERNPNSWPKGESHTWAKFSDATLAEAKTRVASGESQRKVAKSLGIDYGYLNKLLNGSTRRKI